MKKLFFIVGCWLLGAGSFAQTISQKLEKTFIAFEKDSQLKHAISSLYVIDANTGQVVFDKNSQIGLAPASTQKIIISVTAFELLGKDYRYKTRFFFQTDKQKSSITIEPSGDPTFGSWRWQSTAEETIIRNITSAIRLSEIKNIQSISFDSLSLYSVSVPDGWIWQDIANYYGAGSHFLNWRENQFDVILKSGDEIGDSVEIVGTVPRLFGYRLRSELTSAAKGTGDNAYIYFQLVEPSGVIRGTIPVNENSFKISGSMLDPGSEFLNRFHFLMSQGIANEYKSYREFYTHYSPMLDSIIYWFNKKSINLYGEALLKTLAYEKNGFGSTDSGVVIVQNFWKEKGLDVDEFSIVDGSGLSPLNRVTTHSQVEILKYAKTKDWFPYFYNSLPEYNGMSMKSGTIRGVKGFCGYHKAKNGKEYIFSFLVNNYNGSASALVNKMYKVLDILK